MNRLRKIRTQKDKRIPPRQATENFRASASDALLELASLVGNRTMSRLLSPSPLRSERTDLAAMVLRQVVGSRESETTPEPQSHTQLSTEVPDLPEDLVRKLNELLAADDRQDEVIRLLVEHVQTRSDAALLNDPSLWATEPVVYLPGLDDFGQTTWRENRDTGRGENLQIRLGPKAFYSVPMLYSTLRHEYVHVVQALNNPRWHLTPTTRGLGEFQAYVKQIGEARQSGLFADRERMLQIGMLLVKEGWDKMSADDKTEDRERSFRAALDVVATAANLSRPADIGQIVRLGNEAAASLVEEFAYR